jgi:hypothetical protein
MTMATRAEIIRERLKDWMAARKDRKRRGELTRAVCLVTGMHPKSVPRAFRREQMRGKAGSRRPGRPRKYGHDAGAALEAVWEAANRPCGEILFGAIREFVEVLRRDGMWKAHGAEATAQLLAMGEHTVRRRVSAFRKRDRCGKGLSGTRPSQIKAVIPIFKGPWAGLPPGKGQLDTVAHCGSSLAGDFAWTVNYTDYATYWVVARAQWNKGQAATLASMEAVRALLPFSWLMGHPDSGGEFINWLAKRWFDEQGIELTRSEPCRKNDNMVVEERNGHVVRRYLGYVRYDAEECVAAMNELYGVLCPYLNHFIPVLRTVSSERVGAKYKRKREQVALTPYQRVMAHPDVPEAAKERLRAEHASLNPLKLKEEIDRLTKVILTIQSRGTGAGGKSQVR